MRNTAIPQLFDSSVMYNPRQIFLMGDTIPFPMEI